MGKAITAAMLPKRIRESCAWRTAAALAIVIAASVLLRVYGLYARSIWFDEASSWRTVSFPFREMLVRVAQNIHAPLFYVLLKGWVTLFGQSIVSLRSFSAFFAALATLGVFLFASVAFSMDRPAERSRTDERGRWIALVATVLFAVSYFQIRMAWEIRMYSLGTALVLLSSWLLFRAIRAEHPSASAWSIYGVTTLLFAWTHHFALFSIAAQSVFLVGYLVKKHGPHWSRLWKIPEVRCVALSYTIIGAGWCTWLPVFLQQRTRIQAGWWTGPLSFRKVAGAAYGLFFDKYIHGRAFVWETATLAVIVVMLGALLVRARQADWYVATLAATPFGLAIAASMAGTNVMVDRYFAFAQPFLLIAMASLLYRIPFRLIRNAAASLLVLCLVTIHLVFLSRLQLYEKPGARGAAHFIDANRQPGEVVIACSHFVYYPALYYTRDPVGWYLFSSSGRLSPHHGGPISRAGEVVDLDAVKQVASGGIWVITSSSSAAKGENPVPRNWRLLHKESFPEWLPFVKNLIVLKFSEGTNRSGDGLLLRKQNKSSLPQRPKAIACPRQPKVPQINEAAGQLAQDDRSRAH